MPTKNKDKTQQAWSALAAHWRARRGDTIASLFAADARRFERFSLADGDLLLDFSKTLLNRESVELLLNLAKAADFPRRRALLLQGGVVNESENRPALHTALRGGDEAGRAVQAEVRRARTEMLAYAESCRRSKKFDAVVNIGIGGSDLGVRMAAAALAPYCDGPRLRFVSNMDGADLADNLAGLSARRTLFVVSSKSFTTAETLANAARARRWLVEQVGEKGARERMVAVTACPERADAFGVSAVFPYQEWVGGRYSLWSAVGLPLALALGSRHFKGLLEGARLMDEHFAKAPPAKNLPLMLGLIGVWHRTVCGYPTRAMLPYDERLRLLPAHLQQLDMESNGKGVRLDGTRARASAPVVWGGAGTNVQHSFFQFLHQGTDTVPCEFIAAARGQRAGGAAPHRALLANCLAQSAALAFGETGVDAHRRCPGNRPSLTLLHERLTPRALGRLLALFEHRAFVEGTLWGVNPFDQWGVELGKRMAKAAQSALAGAQTGSDASTRGLIRHIRGLSGGG